MMKLQDIFERLADVRRHAAGDMLFFAGDPAEGMFRVVSGEIRVYRMDSQGREVEVVRLQPGDVLGEAILFTGEAYPFFAEAVRESRVQFLSGTVLSREIEQRPETARVFLELLATKCLTLNRKIETLGLKTIRQRLALFLISRCPGGGSCRIDLDMKKSDLARRLGTVSETLSRNLRQLQSEGLIRVDGRRIQVFDCPALRAEIRED